MKSLLHVGCGGLDIRSLPIFFQDGDWSEIRVDIDPSVAPDVVASLQDLSIIGDGAIDALYSSHNIEHVWGFEVPGVLKEFHRVLSEGGVAVVLCPDLASVADAMVRGEPDAVLYNSSAGPISALDILYGHGADLARGRHYMAHKTGFTATSLAGALLQANFSRVLVARDRYYGLHAVAFKGDWQKEQAEEWVKPIFPSLEHIIEAKHFSAEFGSAD